MEISSASVQPGWQPPPTHAPQIRYHNPIPEDDIVSLSAPQTVSSESSVDEPQRPQGRTIREIRLSISQGQGRGQRYSPPSSNVPDSIMSTSAQPKKKSIFGGFFAVKEPTQLALNQVAAQLTAQHGSTSATRVPNVSMEKMPQHVPKVNTKWDGVPEAVKQRERREKEAARAAKRQSYTSSTIRSRSSERISRPFESRQSDRTTHSADSREGVRSSHRKNESRDPNPHRFYAQSVNSSGDLAAQLRPESPSQPSTGSLQSSKTSSTKSVAEGGVFPDDIFTSRKVKAVRRNQSYKGASGHSARSSLGASTKESRPNTAVASRKSEAARNRQQGAADEVVLASSGADVLPLPTATKPKIPIRSNPAFLAGEAQEFLPSDEEESGPSSAPNPTERPPIARRITPDDRPASANDSHNAQLRPKDTLSKRFGGLLKR